MEDVVPASSNPKRVQPHAPLPETPQCMHEIPAITTRKKLHTVKIRKTVNMALALDEKHTKNWLQKK